MRSLMPSMHTLRWALAIVAVPIAALIGVKLGVHQERGQVATELFEYQGLRETHQSELESLRAQRDIADASSEALQKSFTNLQNRSLEDTSTKRLYERIEGSDISSGLGVDTVTRITDANGIPRELHITLVQARGRERVKGKVGVALLGESDGTNWREIIVEADSKTAPRFDMRFFQTLVVPLRGRDVLIEVVEIDVNPTGKRHKPFSVEMEWASIQED